MAAFCPACTWWSSPLRKDGQGRERACVTCASLERHRFFALLLPALGSLIGTEDKVVVDVAPSPATNPVLARVWRTGVVRIDFDPAADGRAVDLRASMTGMPLDDASVDLLISSHVLEHVPDDRLAMREAARVLSPGGVGLIAVPQRRGVTEEDVDASPSERVRRFGQADHVRYYGDDFADRLEESGLLTLTLTPQDVLSPATVRTLALNPTERIWLVQDAASATTKLPTLEELAEALDTTFHEAIAVNGVRTRDLRDDQRRKAASLKRRNEELKRITSNPAYRVATRVRRVARQVVTRRG